MRTRLVALTSVVALAAAGVVTAVATSSGSPHVTVTQTRITTAPGISLDATVYVPEHTPAPAVLVAHGFGGDKNSDRDSALVLARHGYLALTWSARGFGTSTGLAGLDAPDGEVADVSRLVDWLAARPDVHLDAPGDPRVGVTGPSYGGAVSLLSSAADPRIDAIAPSIPWVDLGQALTPQSATAGGPGVVKSGWASTFFGIGTGRPGTPSPCNGFTPEVCSAYAQLQRDGVPDAATSSVLAARSITPTHLPHAPTLVMQGERDTLFPLSQGTSLAYELQAAKVPVKLVWLRGGHDGGIDAERGHVERLTLAWFGRWLRKDTTVDTGPVFEAAAPGGRTVHSASLPSVSGEGTHALDYQLRPLPGGLAGVLTAPGPRTPGAVTIVNPPGAEPGAFSSLPGLSQLAALAGGSGGITLDIPGQAAVFEGPRLTQPAEILGGGTLTVTLTATTPDVVLFAKVYDIDASGKATLPDGQIAPARVQVTPGGQSVTFALPDLSYRFAAGHHVRVVVATTDQGYLGLRQASTITVGAGTGDSSLSLALSPSPATGGLAPLGVAGIAGGGLLVLVAVVFALRRRRSRQRAAVTRTAALAISERTPPLEIRGLTKTWSNGLTAVDDVTLTVAHGEILGLLGPNGAGKTTTLRMALGLIHPTVGEVRIFGTPVTPGSPALERVGAFVEGPGFLPHLSGLDNLQLWWRSNGARWDDAHPDEAIAVAGLGDAIHRPVKSYSQGMRQRLAIAQAMLGDPDLVVLDEPTNGLDPPQIVEMRRVIRAIAERGATVVVSSHLLSEVEQTCTSVAVMTRGALIAQGSVEDVVGADRAVRVELTGDHDRALALLRALPGLAGAERDEDDVVVELGSVTRETVLRTLVSAGVPVTGLRSRHALEETFMELVS